MNTTKQQPAKQQPLTPDRIAWEEGNAIRQHLPFLKQWPKQTTQEKTK